MKLFPKTIYLLFFLSTSLFAHKDFWEIKATAIPDDEKISFSILLSMEQLKEKFPHKFSPSEFSFEDEKLFKAAVIEVAPNILTLEAEGALIEPFVKHAGIITSSFEELEEESLSMAQVDVELELIFPLPESVKDFKVKWGVFTDSLLEKRNVSITSNEITINILDHQFSQFKVSSNKPSFIWKRELSPQSPKLPVINKEKKLLIQQSNLLLPSIIILLSGVLLWSFSNSIILSRSSYILLILALIVFSLSFTKKEVEVQIKVLPDKEKIAKFIKYSLYKIYLSVNRNDWKNMKDLTDDDFLEKLVIENYDSSLKKLPSFVEQLSLSEIKLRDNNTIKFEWYAKTLFQHISHTHSKDLFFSGVFTFSNNEQNWLISDANVRQIFAEQSE